MLKILYILLYALLAVFLLLLWLIICPRSIWIEFDKKDGPVVKVRIFVFKVKVFPLPKFLAKKAEKAVDDTEKEVKKEVKQEAEQVQQAAEEEEKKGGPLADIQFSLNLVKQVLSAFKGIMKRVLASFRFRDVSFTIPVYDKDPHKLQKKYATITGAFYNLNTFLEQILKLTYKAPIFIADFDNQHKDSLYFYCQVTASPLLLVIRAIYALRQYLKIKKENKKVIEKA